MSRLYKYFVLASRFWLAGMVILFVLAFCSTWRGMHKLSELTSGEQDSAVSAALRDYSMEPSLQNALYESLRFFALDSDLSAYADYSGHLNVARWAGVAGWFVTIASVLVRLFHQRALSSFVWWMTWWKGRHVIFAGLGPAEEGRERLAIRLSNSGRDVVVVEPDGSHPSLDACRAAGVVCLQGSAAEATDLRRAGISRVGALVVLGENDAANMDLLAEVVRELSGNPSGADSFSRTTDAQAKVAVMPEQPLEPDQPGNLSFFQQVTEPGLMEVLKRHAWHRNRHDRLHLRIFNQHEMAARAMLRETMIGLNMPQLRKILLVGTGATGRMGEALVVRAIKDQRIDFPDAEPMEIHVLDADAVDWAQCLSGRAQFLGDVAGIRPLNKPATRCGFLQVSDWGGILGENYDAVFICLANESLAVTQAGRVVDAISKQEPVSGMQPKVLPVIVRVREELAGFGQLLNEVKEQPLAHVRPVGMHDRVFDAIASMNPVIEMLAQVTHQDYLARRQQQIRTMSAEDGQKLLDAKAASLQSWTKLSESLRESNRDLVRRYPGMLAIPDAHGKIVRRFHMEFAPDEIIDPRTPYSLSQEELERLGPLEHDNWYIAQYKSDWRFREKKANTEEAARHEALPQAELLKLANEKHRAWLDEKRREGRDVNEVDHFRVPADVNWNENMVPWNELTDGMKQFDYGIIQRLPYVLAKADYKLVEDAVRTNGR
jgi:hypothetical protein